MGLDIACGENIAKVGSYENVARIHFLLLAGLKEYMESEQESADDERIDYLCDILQGKNGICYEKINFQKNLLFSRDNLNGFFSFILHSNHETGLLDSSDARDFLETFDLVKDYLDEELKFNNEFYLNDIFQESVTTGEPIHFF